MRHICRVLGYRFGKQSNSYLTCTSQLGPLYIKVQVRQSKKWCFRLLRRASSCFAVALEVANLPFRLCCFLMVDAITSLIWGNILLARLKRGVVLPFLLLSPQHSRSETVFFEWPVLATRCRAHTLQLSVCCRLALAGSFHDMKRSAKSRCKNGCTRSHRRTPTPLWLFPSLCDWQLTLHLACVEHFLLQIQ